ncbi:MAG TPA: YlxM family DNA-binding protein [Clostridiales bacterium]|nr:YlxM family DNA-binding protein [Clostridiales bacterium]
MIEDVVKKTLLFDFYGQLLTDKQRNIVEMYYGHDLSLSEISEQIGISRQGVYDTLKRAEATLEEYEDRLKLVDRFLQQKKILSDITSMLDEIINEGYDDIEDIKNRLKKIKIFIEKLD